MINEKSLTPEEEKELRIGQEIYEMTRSAGYQHLQSWLEGLAYHSWVDPRSIEGPDSEKEWMWRELNAFHAANNARELMERIQRVISQADYLGKIKSGEIQRKAMKI